MQVEYYTCIEPRSNQKHTVSNRIYGVTALEFRFFAPGRNPLVQSRDDCA